MSGVQLGSLATMHATVANGQTDNKPDWLCPEWAAAGPQINEPVTLRAAPVSDLDHHSLDTKEIGLKDMAPMHGQLCDGLVTGFVQFKAVLHRLFPSGIVDRTDLGGVSRNSHAS